MTTPANTAAAPPPVAPTSAPATTAPRAVEVEDAEVDRAANRDPKPVPYERFRDVLKETKATKAELTAAMEANKTAAARIAELEAELGTVTGRVRKAEARAETGIDDDADLGAFIGAYDKAHADVKPDKRPTMKAWRDSLAADEKAAASSGLAASWRKTYLTQATSGGDTKAPPKVPPKRDDGVVPNANADWAKMTPAEKRAAWDRAMRFGRG